MSNVAVKRRTRPAGVVPKSFPYIDIYRASGVDRIRLVKAGVSAITTKRMILDLRLDQQVLFKALNLKTATVNRKAARNEVLSPDESERVLGIAKLVGQLENMIEESGDASGFDALAWLSRWLRAPLPAFAGVRPIDQLDTMEGQALVSQALAQIQSGAYA